MKRFKILFILLAVTFSCNDRLDIVPEYAVTTENAFTTAEDFDKVLIGAYSALTLGRYYTGTYGELLDLATDMATEIPSSVRNEVNLTEWLYNPSTGPNPGGSWSAIYDMINQCNLILDLIDEYPEQNEGSKNRIIGQALTLRALGHFDLLRLFGQAYERNSERLGIPVRLFQSAEAPERRETVAETYDAIFEDLNRAETLLNPTNLDEQINGDKRYRVDLLGLRAIRARVNLYAGLYQEAIEDATSVILDGSVVLGNTNDFESVWTDDNQAIEVIFAVNLINRQRATDETFLYVNGSNGLNWVPSADVVSLYDPTNDTRFGSYFSSSLVFPDGDDALVGRIVPVKFSGRGSALDGVNDLKIIRMAEMYLIRAEASAELGIAGAMDDLNEVRRNRVANYVDENLSGTALRDAIRNERRKEFWLEGHRWFDLRRYNLPIQRGSDCGTVDTPMQNCFLAADDHRRVFPIPIGEILVSGITQNDGY